MKPIPQTDAPARVDGRTSEELAAQAQANRELGDWQSDTFLRLTALLGDDQAIAAFQRRRTRRKFFQQMLAGVSRNQIEIEAIAAKLDKMPIPADLMHSEHEHIVAMIEVRDQLRARFPALAQRGLCYLRMAIMNDGPTLNELAGGGWIKQKPLPYAMRKPVDHDGMEDRMRDAEEAARRINGPNHHKSKESPCF